VETHALEGIVLVGAGAIKACQSVPQTAPQISSYCTRPEKRNGKTRHDFPSSRD
jgi:hypothetical protein